MFSQGSVLFDADLEIAHLALEIAGLAQGEDQGALVIDFVGRLVNDRLKAFVGIGLVVGAVLVAHDVEGFGPQLFAELAVDDGCSGCRLRW